MTTVLPDARKNKNLEGPGVRARVQKFGGYLAGMIMPNIGAFIAWGLITALFIPAGWAPNETLAELVGPMITYLLPLLIGYTGGRMVHAQRGAVIGAVATMGVIVGSDIPMFLGAMVIAPLAAWILKKFDNAIAGKVPSGFEMLIDNFSLGIIGAIMAVLGRLFIGPVVKVLVDAMASGVEVLVNNNLLPLASIFVEPAKVLFLNNAINHGILTPLGTAEAQEAGKSILFMVESNPGPGLGILIAFWLFGPRATRGSVPGAMIIHLFGGIHEIYFPYVLMKPQVIVAAIAGGAAGIFTGLVLGSGLVSAAAPGSIIAWMIVTPPGGFLPNIAQFLVATIVSFLVAVPLLGFGRGEKNAPLTTPEGMPAHGDDAAAADSGSAVAQSGAIDGTGVRKVIIACDAGMGSSVMVASSMKKKLAPYGVDVTHTPVDQIPSDATIVLTQEGLAERARKAAPQARVVPFQSYVGDPAFSQVEEAIKRAQDAGSGSAAPAVAAGATAAGAATATRKPKAKKKLQADVLSRDAIKLGLTASSKDDAIQQSGELLVAVGAASPEYIDGMHAREQQVSTFMGQGFAIPHGTNESRAHISKAALGFLQFPEGVDWGGKTAYVAIPIASNSGEHIGIMSALATVLADPAKAERLRTTNSVDEVLELLAPEEDE
ncbi:MAG: PTS mannitol transporter subunit IICBA [Dermatophilus congolensis]|nr:PTS mannitol transporter subunit IICBA [Dermatophilus congolensis]